MELNEWTTSGANTFSLVIIFVDPAEHRSNARNVCIVCVSGVRHNLHIRMWLKWRHTFTRNGICVEHGSDMRTPPSYSFHINFLCTFLLSIKCTRYSYIALINIIWNIQCGCRLNKAGLARFIVIVIGQLLHSTRFSRILFRNHHWQDYKNTNYMAKGCNKQCVSGNRGSTGKIW